MMNIKDVKKGHFKSSVWRRHDVGHVFPPAEIKKKSSNKKKGTENGSKNKTSGEVEPWNRKSMEIKKEM